MTRIICLSMCCILSCLCTDRTQALACCSNCHGCYSASLALPRLCTRCSLYTCVLVGCAPGYGYSATIMGIRTVVGCSWCNRGTFSSGGKLGCTPCPQGTSTSVLGGATQTSACNGEIDAASIHPSQMPSSREGSRQLEPKQVPTHEGCKWAPHPPRHHIWRPLFARPAV